VCIGGYRWVQVGSEGVVGARVGVVIRVVGKVVEEVSGSVSGWLG
jgi:hypothetical protein